MIRIDELPPAPYHQVEDLGGTTQAKPRDIPGVGRFAVHTDPNGATFALFLKAR